MARCGWIIRRKCCCRFIAGCCCWLCSVPCCNKGHGHPHWLQNELALSLLLPCLLLGFCRESQIYRIMRLVDWVFYLQLPVVLFQVLVIVPQRVALHGEFEKWDSVVGTFGGDPMGAAIRGARLFCLLVMLVKLSEFRHGLLSLRSVVLHILLAFAICVLGR